MEYTKEILVKDYFDIHNFYSNIYGKNRTIILMQVGSFHECYSTDLEGLNLIELSQKLDIICTKKNGKEPLSKSNPRMIGFPILSTDNYIDKLCNLNYTIVKINQTTDPPQPKREVVAIISPSTNLNNYNHSSNFILSIVIDKIKNNILSIGLASYDLITGNGSFYETYSKPDDIMMALDDGIRYIETCPPKEIILFNKLDSNEKINNMSINDILNYLNLDNNSIYNINQKNNEKLAYQKIIFEKIFINQINIFEILNLHLYNWARFALSNLFDYVINHQINLLNKIKMPILFDNNKYLYLGNHSIEQLNIINKNSNDKSLFQIINNTKTILGKRFLNDSLTKPLINIDDINNRYLLINSLINNSHYEKIANLLEDIVDIERLIRRIDINII